MDITIIIENTVSTNAPLLPAIGASSFQAKIAHGISQIAMSKRPSRFARYLLTLVKLVVMPAKRGGIAAIETVNNVIVNLSWELILPLAPIATLFSWVTNTAATIVAKYKDMPTRITGYHHFGAVVFNDRIDLNI